MIPARAASKLVVVMPATYGESPGHASMPLRAQKNRAPLRMEPRPKGRKLSLVAHVSVGNLSTGAMVIGVRRKRKQGRLLRSGADRQAGTSIAGRRPHSIPRRPPSPPDVEAAIEKSVDIGLTEQARVTW